MVLMEGKKDMGRINGSDSMVGEHGGEVKVGGENGG